MWPWRVWLAFEISPGISRETVKDRTGHFRALRDVCRKTNGKLDVEEYQRWIDVFIDHGHMWGEA